MTTRFPIQDTDIIRRARKRISEMDQVDGAVQQLPLDLAIRTCITALDCAINGLDWTLAADAIVMLQAIEEKVRTDQE